MNNVTKHPTAAIAELLEAMVSIESRHEGLAASMREQLQLMQIMMKRMKSLDARIEKLERTYTRARMDMYMAQVEGHD
jgi:hypothetical protein